MFGLSKLYSFKEKPEMKKGEKYYQDFLNNIITPMFGVDETYQSSLASAGRLFFGPLFLGVFAADKIPDKIKPGEMCIVNLDRSDQSGSHWVALVGGKDYTLLYDSFGRPASGFQTTEQDAEQTVWESNCGQRCLAWLLVYFTYGEKIARQI